MCVKRVQNMCYLKSSGFSLIFTRFLKMPFLQELDYTLIGCKSERIENELCITPLKFGNSTGNVGDDIFIFQHPKGESKKVSYQKISNIIPPYLFYKADTDIGSSGSPVLRQFQLLAIHSKGSDQLKYNKGTLCSEIIQHLTYGTCE